MTVHITRPLPVLRERTDPFSYECHGCGRCCYRKVIRVSPYGIARLAEVLGTTTTTVLEESLEPDGARLRTAEDGACVFLDGTRCSVHAGRPLVCRIYPLSWIFGSEGGERFGEYEGHPDTEGVYGNGEATVGDYLEAQEVAPYTRAHRRYSEVLRRIERLAEREGPDPGAPPPMLDVDRAIAEACEADGVEEPEGVEERVALHLEILHRWADRAESAAVP